MSTSHSLAPKAIYAQAIAAKSLAMAVAEKTLLSLKTNTFHRWQGFANWLIQSPGPRVWCKRDRLGNCMAWYVYDSEMGHTFCFSSELEVRLWFEQHFYR